MKGLARQVRWLIIGVAGVVFVFIVALGLLYAFLKFSVLPLHHDQTLADGRVTTVVTDSFGPVAIAAYTFDLRNGGVGLIDTGSDPSAKVIRESLARAGRKLDDVRAILITHAHADHVGGAAAFPAAQVYVLEPDVAALVTSTGASNPAIVVTRGLRDGDRLDIEGTSVEVFALPGHTPGSAAFLVHGVLFLGDSAVAAHDGTFQPNNLLGVDPQQTERSLRALAERLRPRRGEIRQLAFGHQGALQGLEPLLKWAADIR